MMRVRRAFTMIELIMVIVILGIVGMITVEVLAQAYKGAFYQQKYAEREVELERVLTIIEKRLKDALVDSIVLQQDDGAAITYCNPISTQDSNTDYSAAFIVTDRDSLNGLWNGTRFQNGWSEQGAVSVVGVNTVLNSPDANFTIANTIISAVYTGKTILDAAIYRYPMISNVCTDFGWTGGTSAALDVVTQFNPLTSTQVQLSGLAGLNTQQNYRLASSAIAFKRLSGPAGNTGDGNLTMYSNFRPWEGQNYLAGTASVVSEHVSHFAIRMDSGTAHSIVGNPSLNGAFYRINVCMKVVSDTNDTNNNSVDQICKEKSVYVR